MSYNEYNDLYVKAQIKAPYQMFLFDIEGSKKIDRLKRLKVQLLTRELLLSVYETIHALEYTTGTSILHHNVNFFHMLDKNSEILRGDMMEPFNISGDCFGFTILRNTLEEEIIYDLWREEKENLELDCMFHYANGYYETDDYTKGNFQYFRGYCMQKLEEISKTNGKLL